MSKKPIVFKKRDSIPTEELAESQELFYPSQEEQMLTGFMPIIVDEILKGIQSGLTLIDTAKLLKMPARVVNNWYNKNKGNFKYAVDEALARNKRHHVVKVQKGDKASAWWLERKHKDEFSKEVNITINHRLIDSVAQRTAQVLIRFIKDPDDLRRAAEALQKELNSINVNALPAEITR